MKEFADGRKKFTDIFTRNPRSVLPDNATTEEREVYVEEGKKHMDNILK